MRCCPRWRRLACVLVALLCIVGLSLDRSKAGVHDRRPASVGRWPWPRFTLFGWVSPPSDSTTPARYAEMAGAGFGMTVLAWEDSGLVAYNRLRLDCARPAGLRCLLLDSLFDHVHAGDPGVEATLDTLVARYEDDPAFLGYYLGDEPPADSFPRLAELFDLVRSRDPAHPAWNNLFGRMVFPSHEAYAAYTRAYADDVNPAVLCNDHYDFRTWGDARQLVEDIVVLRDVAREHGIPFMGIVQLIQATGYRLITAGLLRWQVAQWLAHGAHGIGYFTYWTPAPNPEYTWGQGMIAWGSGTRTAYYDMVRALNLKVAPIGNVLAGAQWLTAEYAGSVPPYGLAFAPDSVLRAVAGRATLGLFADSTGAPLLLVGNADSSSGRPISLWLAQGRGAARLHDDGSRWDPLRVAGDGRLNLSLDSGDFALLRLTGVVVSAGAGAPLALTVAPNPARGRVRFGVAGARSAAAIELIDLAGRRVWRRALPAGTLQVEWDGRDDAGRAAASGVYFARLSDAGGVHVRRVSWVAGP